MILANASPNAAAARREAWQSVDPDLLTSLSEEITTLSARVAAETRRLLSAIAEFDRLEGWRREGFASCADWLAYSTRIDKMTAREKVRVARALARLPETSAAMSRGELSFSQARAITRVADAESESELLDHASEMSAAALERLVRSWNRKVFEDESAAEERRHAARCLSIFPADDGSYLIRGRLDPEVGALLMRAIEAASDVMYRGSVPAATPNSDEPMRSVSWRKGCWRWGFRTTRAAPRPNATPSWYTRTSERSAARKAVRTRPKTPPAPARPPSTTGRAFPRKLLDGSHAMRRS